MSLLSERCHWEAITGDVLTQKNSELNLDYISQKVVEMKPAATLLILS